MASILEALGANSWISPIPENSLFSKTLSAIPGTGTILSFLQELSLLNQAKTASLGQDSSRLIELIEVKNDYKIVNMVRCAATIAILVAGLAAGLCCPIFASIGIVVLTASTAWHGYCLYQNKEAIKQLNAGEWKAYIL